MSAPLTMTDEQEREMRAKVLGLGDWPTFGAMTRDAVEATFAELDATREALAAAEAKRAHESQHLLNCCAERARALASSLARERELREALDKWSRRDDDSCVECGLSVGLDGHDRRCALGAILSRAPVSDEPLRALLERAVREAADASTEPWCYSPDEYERRVAAIVAYEAEFAPPQRTVEQIAADVERSMRGQIPACEYSSGKDFYFIPKPLMDELADALKRGQK